MSPNIKKNRNGYSRIFGYYPSLILAFAETLLYSDNLIESVFFRNTIFKGIIYA